MLSTKTTSFLFMIALGAFIFLMLSSFVLRISGTGNVNGNLEQVQKENTVADAIQVSVLNGCGEKGLANEVRKYLRKYGFDVVEIGNYNGTIEKSIVIDRLGDEHSARKTAHVLGISDTHIYTNIDSSLYVRATVIIGKDFSQLSL